jgi:glucosylceramidase
MPDFKKRTLPLAIAALVAIGIPGPAEAAGERVDSWLTTTSDAGGRVVTRGLQQQAPVTFAASSPGGSQTITVDENVTYQQFEGGGASFTDTAAWLLRGGGIVSETTRNDVMRKLFDPVNGIGLAFTRNPMGASDLARFTYDTCCDLNDFTLAPDNDVLALTKQAGATRRRASRSTTSQCRTNRPAAARVRTTRR